MGCLQVVLNVLRTADTSAADQALAVALARVDGPTARAVIETLLARHSREGLKGLIACWHRMDEPVREVVLARGDLIFSALREGFSSPDEQTRINVIEIIRRGRFCRAAYLLDSGLRDREPAVRTAAAQVVYALAEQLIQSVPDYSLKPEAEPAIDEHRRYMFELERYQEDRRQLAAAVDAALASFELHQNAGVIEAAMWLVDDMGTGIWKMLLVPGSRLTRAAQGLLGQKCDPRLVPFMLQALGYAEFRPIVAQALASSNDPAFLEALLRESWRLAQNKTARALTTVRDLGCARNQLADLVCLPADAQRHFTRCVLASGLSGEVKIEVLREMHRRGQPAGRRAALWGLVGFQDPQSTSVLCSIDAEGDPEYAWIARRELARRRPADYPLESLLSGGLSRPAGKEPEPEPMTGVAYWLAYDHLGEVDRVRLGRELLADGRLSPEMVRGWLGSSEPSDKVRALRVVGSLRLAAEFEEQIYRLCHDSHAEVRSAAVAVLGSVPTPTSKRLLHTTLYDPDPRVQANTVEALEQLGGAATAAELIPKLASPDNRTRANAVRALLNLGVREAASTLLLMLRDENRAHRVSGLWLVEQMRLLPLAARVLEMARADEDEQVRGRAKTLAERMKSSRSEPGPAGAAEGKEVLS
jgi:hypothetical protein